MSTAKIPITFLEMIVNLIRIQNEQLLNIIREEERLSIDALSSLVASPYDCKKMIETWSLAAFQ
jgi:hypothetical protein